MRYSRPSLIYSKRNFQILVKMSRALESYVNRPVSVIKEISLGLGFWPNHQPADPGRDTWESFHCKSGSWAGCPGSTHCPWGQHLCSGWGRWRYWPETWPSEHQSRASECWTTWSTLRKATKPTWTPMDTWHLLWWIDHFYPVFVMCGTSLDPCIK